jgi:hypothetical protein
MVTIEPIPSERFLKVTEQSPTGKPDHRCELPLSKFGHHFTALSIARVGW